MGKLRTQRCQGEGQGSCKRCTDNGKWNVSWMTFLYKIEGMEGCYCSDCIKEMEKEMSEMSEAEKKVLKERAQSMCEGEQRATLSGIPTYLVYEEVGRRLERQGVFIDSISSIVQKHTEV